VSLVRTGYTVLIDAGSSNSAIADALPDHMGLTVITTAPDIAQRLMDRHGFEILLIGGRIDIHTGSAVGIQTALEIRRVRAEVCFPGTCATDRDTGIWGMNNEEALVKHAMIESSRETAVVVTTDKFSAIAPYQIATLDRIDHLVVEHGIDNNVLEPFEAASVTVHRADRGAAD
jgi:DeoR/GlpR family transcriptional regulator of sugar metabolism